MDDVGRPAQYMRDMFADMAPSSRVEMSGLILIASILAITLNMITGPAQQLEHVIEGTVCGSILTAALASVERTGTAALAFATMLFVLITIAVLTQQHAESGIGILGATLIVLWNCFPAFLIGIILITWGLFRGSSEISQ